MVRGIGLIGAGLVAFGCQSRPLQPVWVDLDRLLVSRRPAATANVPAMPTPPGAEPARTVTVPARSATVVQDPSNIGNIDLSDSVAAAQERALRLLRRRLGAIYARDADRFEREELARLSAAEAGRYSSVLPILRTEFERYADRRLPKVVRLALIAGFPDPAPDPAAPIPAGLSPIAQRYAEEAKQLRLDLQRIDRAFLATAEEILAQAESLTEQERATALLRIAAFRDQMQQRALEEAANPFDSTERRVMLTLAARRTLKLPATPARSVTLPALPAMAPPPKVEFDQSPTPLTSERTRLERQLRIWLALNDFVLEERARDATPDFYQWTRTYRVGR